MSVWPIARNFSGGKSDGADRLVSESDALVGFMLRGFLAGTAFDFGKFLTHFGGERSWGTTCQETGELFHFAPRIFEQTQLSFRGGIVTLRKNTYGGRRRRG